MLRFMSVLPLTWEELLAARTSETLKEPTNNAVDMAQISLFLDLVQPDSFILCFRMRRVAGVIGSLVLVLVWVLARPLTAALERVEEPADQGRPCMVWIFLTLDL